MTVSVSATPPGSRTFPLILYGLVIFLCFCEYRTNLWYFHFRSHTIIWPLYERHQRITPQLPPWGIPLPLPPNAATTDYHQSYPLIFTCSSPFRRGTRGLSQICRLNCTFISPFSRGTHGLPQSCPRLIHILLASDAAATEYPGKIPLFVHLLLSSDAATMVYPTTAPDLYIYFSF